MPAPTMQPAPAAQLLASATQLSNFDAASLLLLPSSVMVRTQPSAADFWPHSVASRSHERSVAEVSTNRYKRNPAAPSTMTKASSFFMAAVLRRGGSASY